MSDLIDREALLRQIDIDSDGEPGYYGDTWKFIDTIKRMPSALSTNLASLGTDCISRQQAIEAVQNRHMMLTKEKALLINDLEKLPPAEPKRGKWQYHSYIPHNKYCLKCGKDSPYNKLWDFCPNCGSYNGGENEI